MTRFGVTHLYKNGLRGLTLPAQGRHMHDTREMAESWLQALLANNSEERLASVYGPQALGTFRVDSFDCYDHGDPKGIYAD